MAKQVINTGTTANDGTGDPLRSAFDKVNDNFTELYDDDAGDVGSFTNANGTYVSAAVENTAATGAVTTGAIDLSAVDGTDTSGKFLSKDNKWAVVDVGVESITATSPLAVDASTGDVTLTIEDGLITALQLAVSTNGSSGQSLISNGDGTFSWQYFGGGTVYEINADAGLTGGGSGLSTVNLAVNPDNETIEIVSDQVKVKPYQIVNLTVPTNQNGLKNHLYIFSSTSATISTLTLPASPAAGDSIKISNIGLQANVINPNGEKIMATAGSMTIDTPNSAFELIYSGVALTGWIILSNV